PAGRAAGVPHPGRAGTQDHRQRSGCWRRRATTEPSSAILMIRFGTVKPLTGWRYGTSRAICRAPPVKNALDGCDSNRHSPVTSPYDIAWPTRVPSETQPDAGDSLRWPERVIIAPMASPLSILLVEDDPDLRAVMEIALGETEHAVTSARDGAEALA